MTHSSAICIVAYTALENARTILHISVDPEAAAVDALVGAWTVTGAAAR